jgi:predicted nucleotidyltransferase
MNERFGIEARHWAIIESLMLIPLRSAGVKLWVFGSRARGDHRPFSDLDVLIEGSIDPVVLGRVQEALHESTLPITVDLVCDHDLAQSYRRQVLIDRKPL